MSHGHHHPPIISVTRRRCGPGMWRIDVGNGGVGRAAWCPERALLAQRHQAQIIVRPDQVQVALSHARLGRRPAWAWFSPREDAFAPGVSEVRRREVLTMIRTLLQRDIELAIKTRGGLPQAEQLVQIAAHSPGRLAVTVGIFAADPALTRTWEAGLPPVAQRLALASRLADVGADVTIEIGPLIPFVNADERHLAAALRTVSRAGLERVTARWIEDGPGLVDQIQREVCRSSARMLKGWFHQPGSLASGTRRVIPLHVRRGRRQNFNRLAAAMGLRVAHCACAQAGASCSCISAPRGGQRSQLDLFGHPKAS